MSETRRLILATAAMFALATPLAAQEQGATQSDPAPAPSTLLRAHVPAPPFALPAPAASAEEAAAETSAAAAARARTSSTTLMIVGGAAMLLGAVVDGDGGEILMVGGAVVLLVGLYQYLR